MSDKYWELEEDFSIAENHFKLWCGATENLLIPSNVGLETNTHKVFLVIIASVALKLKGDIDYTRRLDFESDIFYKDDYKNELITEMRDRIKSWIQKYGVESFTNKLPSCHKFNIVSEVPLTVNKIKYSV